MPSLLIECTDFDYRLMESTDSMFSIERAEIITASYCCMIDPALIADRRVFI